MSDSELGRKDAETNYFLWMCMYDTSLKSLRRWLKRQKFSKAYINGYLSYMRNMNAGYR